MIEKNADRYAVVSGGTKGIGRAIADTLLDLGYHTIVIARGIDELNSMKVAHENLGNRCIIFKADLSNKTDVNKASKFVLEQCSSLDILVNNAGSFVPGEILSEPEGQLEKMISTNLYSAYYLTRGLKTLYSIGTCIYNICSVASIQAYPNGGSYSISKYAMLGWSKNLRLETQDQGIKVVSILPGATWSASWDGVDMPQERLMQPQDIATLIRMTLQLSPSAVPEEIVIRPQLGDI